mmetsp:Transcript_45106/g.97328  ORF Transcript_45106/g.97328 Transcript_45106/m.97328 type:complete len:594 (-) Transcript_45106:54-1835(-)
MKAGAAATLRLVLEARSIAPEEPCLLLLGRSPEALDTVRTRLRASNLAKYHDTPEADPSICGLRADITPSGATVVTLPEVVHTPAEATEMATFLRGLRDAHGVLLACSATDEPVGPPIVDTSAEVLPLLSDFYSGTDLPVLLTLTDPDLEPGDLEGLRAQLQGRYAAKLPASSTFEVYQLSEQAESADSLLSRLRRARPLVCEPLQCKALVMTQYRSIREQLGTRSSQFSNPSGGSRKNSITRQMSPPLSELTAEASPGTTTQGGSCSSTSSGLTLPHRNHWTLMVFGKTGAGKSHLANLLVGHNAFRSGDSLSSVTGTDSIRKAYNADKSLMVLDTIGFGDTKLPPDVVSRSLRDTASEAPGGIDILMFVLKKERVAISEKETLAFVTKDLFGEECVPNVYMVVTHAGRLAKDKQLRGPWLKEQVAESETFAEILSMMGPLAEQRIAFVENSDPSDAEDDEDRLLAERRRARALEEIAALLASHRAPAYQHSLMKQAGELQAMRLEEMKKTMQQQIESKVRQELEEERKQLHEDLEERQQELQRRLEEEWALMKNELEDRAKELARADIEPLAQELVEKTEKKAKNWRCVVM